MDFISFVKNNLVGLYNKLKPIYTEWSNGATDDCLSYYIAHKPRFDAMVSLISSSIQEAGRVAEFGSFIPYTGYCLNSKNVDCYDILFRSYGIEDFTFDKYGFKGFNLCTDSFDAIGKYDLIIISEVMEHLPCNLFELGNRVCSALNNGGYLLATYPLGGFNPKDYDKDLGDHGRFRHEHLREFTEETVPLFFKSLTVVGSSYVDYPAYGRIKIVLYKKEE